MSLPRNARAATFVTLLGLAMTGAPRLEAGDLQAGPRFSVSDDAGLGLGADLRWRFLPEDRRLALTASFDYFFPEDGGDEADQALRQFQDLFGAFDLPFDIGAESDTSYWEANANLTWDFTSSGSVIPYAGLGLNYARARVSTFGLESEDDDVGVNVLTGLRIRDRFHVEAKREAGGGELFVLTVGVRF